jgi:hypothetical protein
MIALLLLEASFRVQQQAESGFERLRLLSRA